ncbi:tyrosine kinase receptor Cad96Ca isoform X1 [Neodiprion virginianus]|uniref:Tyrosine kinase receptor Cad96Ca isoform X1 n=1 Tax=Neodiprion lecontei TaxID=441921 RepID=A0A6J0C1I9_NEOLC|nr:tyrosine kinase receptor Cad96Ca isoform X1 [Neodiprion lecontei]XP_046415953.1 tyrosine kinase receptor Cad96Ca isoform X1 [Neodiprion fabricii]XP_046609925.1 tyrosine kinase receptor Cad96Ca isoform X1 [Neodiprion virginianus]
MFVICAIIAAAAFFTEAGCQYSDNTPPVTNVYRDWVVADNATIGTVVTVVRAEDNEQTKLTYGLEPVGHTLNWENAPQRPLPFYIDNSTGTVFTNESLLGRGGESLSLYVTVSDGKLEVKTEVYARILNSSARNGGHSSSRSPYPQPSGDRFRPPFGFVPYHGSPQPPDIFAMTNRPPPPLPPPATSPRTTILHPQPSRTKKPEVLASSTSPPTSKSVASNEILGTALSNNNVNTSEQNGPQDLAMTIVPVAAVCALVLGLGMGAWSLRHKFCSSKKSKEEMKESASATVSNLSDNPSLVFSGWGRPKARSNTYEGPDKENPSGVQSKVAPDDWEFPRHRLKIFNILGEGCFGQVWKCEAQDIDGKPGPSIVAVKTLKENATERERLDLAQELKVMKSLETHPNVVRLLGCCTEREPMFVILEYVSGGKLQSFLRASREERNHGGPGLTSRDLTGFVYQIARGMEYLATRGVIHRDLAARNILIDENRACKVADFGFARDVAANQIYERKSEGRLPIRWMAPESLYDNIFSVKSDIWSFGVLIWEIVTLGSTPYPGLAAAEVMKRIKEGYRLDRPEHCKRELYNIMYYCWDKDPACRPSFTELVNLAEGLLLDETDYIELDRFPDHSYYNVLSLSGEKL